MNSEQNYFKIVTAKFISVFLLILAMSSSGCGTSDGFTIAPAVDTTAPSVSSTTPEDGAVDVPINRVVTANFSEAMSASTLNLLTFTLAAADATLVSGTVDLNTANRIATFTPDSNLAVNTTYTATVSTGAQDSSANGLADDFVWTFTTGATADITAPTVDLTTPDDAQTDVAINASVNATFSEHMSSLSLTTSSFSLTGPDLVLISGSVVYDFENDIATFTPDSNLEIDTTYTATITTVCEDLSGNPLASDFVWSFVTGSTVAMESVALGSNNAFAILAGSTVTNTGPTMINGDLGLSPGTAVTGFPPGTVNGAIHAGDSTAAQAMLDLTTAYNDAAGRSTAPITISGNLGGQTLAPGLYKSTSSLEITSGDLTLDAQGDANAVFIFQMASTLTTTVDRQVILSGGANAANIYWQVGTSATLGTNSIFQGNILADQSITLTTGATLNGRALTRIGAVALDSNTVTTP
jgi:hypothetical protein